MNDRMNILILHQMGDPRQWLFSVQELEYSIPVYAPEHNYIVHNAFLPLPSFVRDIEFHGVVLGPTFLCNRYNAWRLKKTLHRYSFLKEIDAVKLAMPQDDYDCSAILERWLIDWGVDRVYTVCPEHWDILYPTLSLQNKVQLGYTGYISDAMIERWKEPKKLQERSIDVSYRATKLPPNFGSIGNIKGIIGDIFREKVDVKGLNLDISTNIKDRIHGEHWLDFIEDSKCVLVSNSGSSLWDPEGEFRIKVNQFLRSHPGASFDDVKGNVFEKEDGEYVFTAISPRNIEAALAETVQICTPGSYSNIMLPDEHYVPLELDGKNAKDVGAFIRDNEKLCGIAKKCKEVFLSTPELQYRVRVKNIIETIAEGASKRHIVSARAKDLQLVKKYENRMLAMNTWFWPAVRTGRRAKRTVRSFLNRMRV